MAEIGLGFRYVRLVHLLGHARLRTLQFVRASQPLTRLPHNRERDRAATYPRAGTLWDCWPRGRDLGWLYQLSLERGYLDRALIQYVVAPFVRAFRWCDALERRWTDFVAGEASRESDQVKPRFGTIEEFS